jgi:nucleoside-diphosphate-sugar epimerase
MVCSQRTDQEEFATPASTRQGLCSSSMKNRPESREDLDHAHLDAAPTDVTRTVLITGGAGFLGRVIVDELLEDGGWDVRVLDLRITEPLPHGVEAIEADLLDEQALGRASAGVDAIVHTASRVDWGRATAAELEAVNVGGVEAVVRTARRNGVRAIVHTSTMDVVCGTGPVVDADETTPFPTVFANDYSRTKAAGEVVALAADDDGLRVCAIRPCGMFGERDPYHLGNVLPLLKAGKLPMRIGNGSSRFQHVYVGNVAHAHVLALHDLLSDQPRSAGQAYFITDTEAADFLDHLEPIVSALGYRLPTRRLPEPVAMTVAAAMEGVAAATRRVPFLPTFTPTLTRSTVRFVCHDHTFDGSKAQRDLGYEPKYPHEVALARTIEWWRHNG